MTFLKNHLKIIIVTVSVLFLLIGCNSREKKNKELVFRVQAENAKKMNIPIYIESFGTLKAGDSTEVKAQVSGQIVKKYFDAASYVKAGDPLFEINTSSYKAAVNNDQAMIEYDKADYNLKKYYVEKNQSLVSTGAYSKQDYEKLKADLEMAAAKIKIDLAKLEEDKVNLDHCYVKAPIDGMTGINNYGVGDYASVNDTLANINNISYLYIDFPVPENNYSRIKNAFDNKTLDVEVTIFSISKDGAGKIKKIVPATINYLNNTTDSTSSTITLEAKIDNSDFNLLPSQFAYVKLKIGELKNATAVPTEAIQVNSTEKFVYTINKENHVSKISVDTGAQFGSYTSINQGKINPGDKIVTIGANSLNNGAKVNIINNETKQLA